MKNSITETYEYRAKIMKALAHPTRLFIVDELSKGKKCVCMLTEMIESDTSTVSKHLSVLKNAGIVKTEKVTNRVYYKLTYPCVLNFFKCIDNVIEKNAEAQLNKLNKNGG